MSSQNVKAADTGSVEVQSGLKGRSAVGFDKTHLLPALFGEYDHNLILIEQRLNVAISARGNRATIVGDPADVAQAEAVLQALYRIADTGGTIDDGVIHAQIGFSSKGGLTVIHAEPGNARDAVPMISIRTRKMTLTPRNAAQGHYMQKLANDEMVFAVGPAGTGKTYVAVAQAVSMLIAGKVDRLVLSRPAVEAGERLGFLPGDMKDKVDPYLRPIYDALHECLPAEQVERRIESGEIEIAPIAFMRGRTLSNAFILLDEAQNTTPAQMKMFLTRFGQNSRMVICGDARQNDLPHGAKSGLVDALERLEGVQGISVAKFDAADVVRHQLVGRIVSAYGD